MKLGNLRVLVVGRSGYSQIDDTEMNALNLKMASFHGEWNYTLLPKRKTT